MCVWWCLHRKKNEQRRGRRDGGQYNECEMYTSICIHHHRRCCCRPHRKNVFKKQILFARFLSLFFLFIIQGRRFIGHILFLGEWWLYTSQQIVPSFCLIYLQVFSSSNGSDPEKCRWFCIILLSLLLLVLPLHLLVAALSGLQNGWLATIYRFGDAAFSSSSFSFSPSTFRQCATKWTHTHSPLPLWQNHYGP